MNTVHYNNTWQDIPTGVVIAQMSRGHPSTLSSVYEAYYTRGKTMIDTINLAENLWLRK